MTNLQSARRDFEVASDAHDLADKIAERLTLHTSMCDWSEKARAAVEAARITSNAKYAAAETLNRASNPSNGQP